MPTPAPAEAPPVVSPPELLEGATPVYPEQAKAERLEATVMLRLSIDVAGQVTASEVLEPAAAGPGYGFDEAAQAAALRLRFKPAQRAGQPLAARIRYAFAFKLPPEPAPVAEPTPQALTVAPPEPETETGKTLPAPAPTSGEQPVEVSVVGGRTAAQRLQESAEAVNVIDTRKAQRQTADLGEVLARTQGVGISRDGGLGSGMRFSLNGLYDDQVRFFMDGVPLELSGFPAGLVNVPVNMVDYVEVYRGVVPIRFGADTLGGAVNLVTDQTYETSLNASYQVGSFGTHRATLQGRYRNEETGFIAGASAIFDISKNDYEIAVEIPDERGRLSPARVPRFHDGYMAYNATVEVGVVDKPWARRLLLKGYTAGYDKELQHNIVMTVPYGGITYGDTVFGLTGRYDVALHRHVDLEVVAAYAHHSIDFKDTSEWVYNWRGQRIRQRRIPGELDTASDQTTWQHGVFGRSVAKWAVAPGHAVRLALTPQFTTRTGDERIQADPTSRDPLTAQRDLFTFVSGLEYEANFFDDKLSNIIFVKDYYYSANSEEPLPGGVYRARDNTKHSQGVGDTIRYRFAPWLIGKASYEYATRLPRPDEVFGDGMLTLANLTLEPEVSHNVNVGPRLDLDVASFGQLIVDINGFLRDTDKLIVLLGNDRTYTYQNVYKARTFGIENAVAWTSPGRWLSLDGTVTWLSSRNTSTQGTFGDFEGDRIPNRPYLFGSWGARLRFPHLPGVRDTVEPYYNGRYRHEFFRGWESQGLREFKQVVDAQVTHSIGVSYTLERSYAHLTTTVEIDNLTDARVFDNFGVQRPGRAVYVKITGKM